MIAWGQFGLKKSPYDTLPLDESSELLITDAFVGRERERKHIDAILTSEGLQM